MDEYIHDAEECCPHCGEEAVKWRHCDRLGCEDGLLDAAEEEPEDYLLPDTTFLTCTDCKGHGIIHWCSACGKEVDYPAADDEANDEYLFL